MNRISILIMAILIVGFILASCGDDDITELGWRNASSEAINEIIWADGDGMWAKTNGYASLEFTESQEVDLLIGDVECYILDGDEFVEATVTIAETNSGSLALSEGESYVYTITADPVAKKK